MKTVLSFLAMLVAFATPALASVTVSSPANNSTVASPVAYSASASSTCSSGIAAMGIYVNNQLAYKQNGASLNTSLTLNNGYYNTVVQEWDNCGGASNTPVNITVGSGNTGGTTGVTVTSPANNSTVSSPVTFSAQANTATCAKGISAIGIYIDNVKAYTTNGAVLQTSLAISAGPHRAVVQAWDNCGGSFNTPVAITVQSTNATAVNISASPASITAGGSSVLTVTASNATQVTVQGSDGSSYTLPNGGGQQTVTPTATTTYTATATGASGTVTSATTVTVGQNTTAVTVTAPANNSTVSSPVTFTASATTAACSKGIAAMGIYIDNVKVYTSNGSTLQTSLSITAGPHRAVVQAWDNCGGAIATPVAITVQSANAASVNISASPASINPGGSSTLTVTASNATGVTVQGSDGSSYTLSNTGGQQTVTPKATTTYTATATSSSGNVTSTATVTVAGTPTVSVTASPSSISTGGSSTLTVTASNATQVTVTGSDGSSYTLPNSGGTQTVSPASTTTYTAKATSASGNNSATTTVTVVSSAGLSKINHMIFMLQENHSFDNYFGMLNPYRQANHWNVGADGQTYNVDGIDDKLNTITNDSDEGTVYAPFKFVSTCVDDMTSSWLESYGDVNRYDFSTTRKYKMDGFVHTAENFAKYCADGTRQCSGNFTDLNGKRAMGYYDQGFLNYYYYMASQFALSDRWFSPVSSKSIPNRIATFSGGTTQGLAFDPGSNDHLPQLNIPTIFSELDTANVSWKIYYTTTEGGCMAGSACGSGSASFPDTIFNYFTYAYQYLYQNPNGGACKAPTVGSSAVGDTSNSFCIDPNHIAPLSTYYTDLSHKTLPSFSFIESGAGKDDEHPGSGQSVLTGQSQVASVVNALMTSPSWSDSAFFLSYDEGGGPYDHVPPVAGHSNQNTDAMVGSTSVQNIPDISGISVNPDSYGPCLAPGGVPTLHCDLPSVNDPAGHSTDAAAQQGFAAQLGFRLPNMVISPFTRQHYVSHIPMDHTAVIKFVENRFIGPSAHLTARDAAQPSLLDFFDFNAVPWATPPTPPAPVTPASLGYDPCTPQTF